MTQVPPAALVLAGRVFSYEVGNVPEPATLAAAAERADARLRARLTELVGQTGYSTLVVRAQRLAQAELPGLQPYAVYAGGNEIGAYVEFARLNSAHPRAAGIALTTILAHVIGLLITFIGEDLALRLVYEAWPEIARDQVTAEELT